MFGRVSPSGFGASSWSFQADNVWFEVINPSRREKERHAGPHQGHSTRSRMPYRSTSGRVGSRLSCLHLSSARYTVGRHPTADTRRFCRVSDKTRQEARMDDERPPKPNLFSQFEHGHRNMDLPKRDIIFRNIVHNTWYKTMHDQTTRRAMARSCGKVIVESTYL